MRNTRGIRCRHHVRSAAFRPITRRPHSLPNVTPPKGVPWQYNFWDYQEAGSKTFLYQNKNCGHSWFLRLDLEKLSCIPLWFLNILSDIGPEPSFLPHYVKIHYDHLCQCLCSSQRFSQYKFVQNELFI